MFSVGNRVRHSKFLVIKLLDILNLIRKNVIVKLNTCVFSFERVISLPVFLTPFHSTLMTHISI